MPDSDSSNSFDRLVSGISSVERKALLEKLQNNAHNVEAQTLEPPFPIGEKTVLPLDMEFRKEPFLYRLWVWIRTLFNGNAAVETYNSDRVARIATDISHSYTGLVDYSHGYLCTVLYEKLKELKICADFFKPYIGKMEEDPGAFYVFLGTFLIPELTARMNEEVDPFLSPVTPEVNREHRTALLHKMDSLMKDLSADSRHAMYKSVGCVEWLRQFTKLPHEQFLDLFTSVTEGNFICSFSDVDQELSAFARVLCAGKSVSGETLEALYLFAHRDSDPEGLESFLDRAETQLSVMHIFISTVPIRSLACVVYNNANWLPQAFGGAEDWFIKYREQWKKVFDKRWEAWVQACKKEEQRISLKEKFGLDSFPLLPNRPWGQMWGGLVFHYELTGGFLYWFFVNQYAGIVKTLKTLQLEGVFTYSENRDELASLLNDFSRINLELKQFVMRLAPDGETGLIFDKLSGEHLRTLQGQNKIDSMLLAAENEIKTFETQFCKASRSISDILSGAFSEGDDKKYGTVKNLKTIKSRDSRNFYDELQSVREHLTDILSMFSQIELLDAAGFKA